MKSQTIIFDPITPHPEPVQIANLLTDIEGVIKKHVILSDHAAAALAVWVLHTWTFELRDIVAYVAIESPEKRCGKTTLLSVLAAMSHKPLIASNVTVGALFRAIDNCRPTLFIDEADTFLAGNGIMRGIINSGNTWRTAYVLRLSTSRHNRRTTMQSPLHEPNQSFDVSRHRPTILPLPAGEGRGEGELDKNPSPIHSLNALPMLEAEAPQSPPENPNTGLQKYSCWCPKVIAMIGQVPDTIADRSIVVPMIRKRVSENCAALAELNTAEIKAKCARFALDAGPAIAQSPKIRGEGLNDRAADTFDPLYVIARLAGDGWEQKLHTAALSLASIGHSDNSGAELLLDILCIFLQRDCERILIRDLALALREGSMRSFALKYSTINEQRISQILRSYGVKTTTVRVGKEVGRGYVQAQFHEAVGRYVPQDNFHARVEELRRREKLQAEARAEAEKEEALIEQVLAEAPKDRLLDVPEAMAIITRLRAKDCEKANVTS